MNIFEWLNPKQSEVDRAIALMKKQKARHRSGDNVFYIGKYVTVSLLGPFFGKSSKKYFNYYTVKFSSNGTKAMISKDGSVDFFFTTQEEVDALRSAIINHFQ